MNFVIMLAFWCAPVAFSSPILMVFCSSVKSCNRYRVLILWQNMVVKRKLRSLVGHLAAIRKISSFGETACIETSLLTGNSFSSVFQFTTGCVMLTHYFIECCKFNAI